MCKYYVDVLYTFANFASFQFLITRTNVYNFYVRILHISIF